MSGLFICANMRLSTTEEIQAIQLATCEVDGYLKRNGMLVQASELVIGDIVSLVPRLRGGKGGFGSMLRAIGAQIEKTTNREACRDLSGRRLRDINEEKRMKTWIDKQSEREAEAKERKQAKIDKLEKILVNPKHNFEDKFYMDQKEKQIDNIHEALEAASSSCNDTSKPGSSVTSSLKRPASDANGPPPKKKTMLWLDPDMSDCSDISDSESENNDPK